MPRPSEGHPAAAPARPRPAPRESFVEPSQRHGAVDAHGTDDLVGEVREVQENGGLSHRRGKHQPRRIVSADRSDGSTCSCSGREPIIDEHGGATIERWQGPPRTPRPDLSTNLEALARDRVLQFSLLHVRRRDSALVDLHRRSPRPPPARRWAPTERPTSARRRLRAAPSVIARQAGQSPRHHAQCRARRDDHPETAEAPLRALRPLPPGSGIESLDRSCHAPCHPPTWGMPSSSASIRATRRRNGCAVRVSMRRARCPAGPPRCTCAGWSGARRPRTPWPAIRGRSSSFTPTSRSRAGIPISAFSLRTRSMALPASTSSPGERVVAHRHRHPGQPRRAARPVELHHRGQARSRWPGRGARREMGVSACASAWQAPRPFWNAIAPCIAATIMSAARAQVAAGSFTATGSERATRAMPSIATASASG